MVAIYSTFLQRAYDNVIHDIAVQQLPVIFSMDRAGLVGEDGQTHMGLYDIAYMLAVPGMTVTAPKDGDELIGLLRAGLGHTAGPFCTRYPRDKAPADPRPAKEIPAVPYGTWEQLRSGREVAILAVGTMVLPAVQAAELLAAEGIECSVVNCRFLKPLDTAMLDALTARHHTLVTVEEGTIVNGFGAYLAETLQTTHPETRVVALGVPDRLVEQAPRADQLETFGLTALAAEHPELVAVTAAMPSGTGTNIFEKTYPERFFDVGIAEGHAVTFAGGLATQGVRPVVAIYSTFLQRAYDNVIHDIAVQHLPVIFSMDRAGLVGEDGQTHMGLYDIAYMLAVPTSKKRSGYVFSKMLVPVPEGIAAVTATSSGCSAASAVSPSPKTWVQVGGPLAFFRASPVTGS